MLEGNWFEFLGLAGFAGVVTAVLNAAFGVIGSHVASYWNARHLALELAVLFEGYASQAAGAAFDIDFWISSDGRGGTRTAPIPKLPEFPREPDAWRFVRPQLRDMALSYPNDVSIARANLAFRHEATRDNAMADLDALEQNLHLADIAYQLARRLRAEYFWSGIKSDEMAELVGRTNALKTGSPNEH